MRVHVREWYELSEQLAKMGDWLEALGVAVRRMVQA